jgi:tRNA (guanine10-N2)-dimethyltransferase
MLREVARAFGESGGRIDLDHPSRDFLVASGPRGSGVIYEQVATVPRSGFSLRATPRLSYQRPVTLAPKLGRVAVNLARIRPGDRVLDPFVGTGALMIEAALLGASVTGIDRSAEMVRGAARNFESFQLAPEALIVGDAANPDLPRGRGTFDALVTDPPYGRASSSSGEEPGRLIARVLKLWATSLSDSARIVVVLPGGPEPIGPPWRRVFNVPDRRHRSLTREFRVYQRGGSSPTPVLTAE